MNLVIARLNPLSGPRFPFGQEAKGIVKLIENGLRGGNRIVQISVATPTQLLATDLWCQHKKYTLVVTDEQGHKFESVTDAHRAVNKEYIFLDLVDIANFSIDIDEK